jgi:hypothetical protein
MKEKLLGENAGGVALYAKIHRILILFDKYRLSLHAATRPHVWAEARLIISTENLHFERTLR